ncbi:MAG TPA: DUF2306 domain-containing protein [Thermoanaerobaculia bacterium]|nr:DUF2306 domain-containing protein [Thermoanaerobaculia bacterium]
MWSILMLFAGMISLYAFAYVIVGERMYPPDLAASFLSRPWGINPHALFGGTGLLLGAVQFHRGLRRRLPIHRLLGRIYVVSCLVTGLAGMYMAVYSYGGWITHLGFGTLGALLVFTTIVAFLSIRKGDVERHRSWMIRSYALMFAAVTLRLELPFLGAAFGFDDGYRVVAWLCWIPNALIAEAIVRNRTSESVLGALAQGRKVEA